MIIPLDPQFLREDRLQQNGRMVIMVGLARTGKSTFVNKLVKDGLKLGVGFTILSCDDVRRALGVRYNKALNNQVYATLNLMADAMMHRRQNLIIDCCNLSEAERTRWIQKAMAHEYGYCVVEIEPLPEHEHKAICERHLMPWSYIEQQKARYQPVTDKAPKRYALITRDTIFG